MEFSASLQHLIRNNEPLAQSNWLQLGGPAKYYAEPNTVDQLCGLVAEAATAGLPVRVLGDGSNVVVRDSGFDGLIVNLGTAELSSIEVADSGMTVGGGAKLSHAISASVGAGQAGLEYLAGIPGTVGGAIACNAGVKNGDIGSRVVGLQVVDINGQLSTLDRESLQFGFRRSNLDDSIIVRATLKLEPVDAVELTRRMQTAWILKRSRRPISGTRAVQAFIEPDGVSLTEVLESANLRGHSQNALSLSSEYPGMLIVKGETTSEELLAFIASVTSSVEARTGVQLQSALKIW